MANVLFDGSDGITEASAIRGDAKRKPVATADLPGRAVALREALRDKKGLPLTVAERGLLDEWLNQLADHAYASGGN